MKQYLTPEQTAKLIELGFEKPKNTQYVQRVKPRNIHSPFIEFGEPEFEGSYSIGELIEMLPPTIRMKKKNLVSTIARTEYNTFVSYSELDGTPHIAEHSAELIDTLYNMVVKLKEERVI